MEVRMNISVLFYAPASTISGKHGRNETYSKVF
jgi:hypothetical protein